jgi:cation transport regulator
MPYRSVLDLPPAVQQRLPAHAQDIFLSAFNHAYEEYADRQDREAIAFRTAWAAVKRKYKKQGNEWIERLL